MHSQGTRQTSRASRLPKSSRTNLVLGTDPRANALEFPVRGHRTDSPQGEWISTKCLTAELQGDHVVVRPFCQPLTIRISRITAHELPEKLLPRHWSEENGGATVASLRHFAVVRMQRICLISLLRSGSPE